MPFVCEEKVNKTFVSAIIVSAGSSSRMGGVNKQFLEIDDIPVIAHSIIAFENCDYINEIVIVTRDKDISAINKIVEEYEFSKVRAVVCGGDTRQKSVINGLNAVCDKAEFIAIHDGARPLVSEKVIVDTLSVAIKTNAATTGVKVIDTIKVVDDDNIILSTPERACLRAVQTPQIFNKKLYLDAVSHVENSDNFTDDCKLIEAYGQKVTFVDGDYENIKITTPNDIFVAEAYFAKRRR
jgi:2-C-methyl-D-erythritol 4-phosphate cytidylyltransferase